MAKKAQANTFPIKTVALLGALFAMGGLITWRLLAKSPEDLLNVASPTPQQIRTMAVDLLNHPDMQVRSKASEKLASLGAAAAPVLTDVASHNSNPDVRFAAVGVLRTVDVNAATSALTNMLGDSNPGVRGSAVMAAAQVKDPSASAVLERALSDPDPGVRSGAAAALSSSGTANSIPKLQALLNDPDQTVRRHAARAIRSIQGTP